MRISALTALAATAVPALGLQLNWYYDGGCTDFASSPPAGAVDISGDCYNWSWGGSNSANIAGWNAKVNIICEFWTETGCTGDSQNLSVLDGTIAGSNCASNTQWAAVQCWAGQGA